MGLLLVCQREGIKKEPTHDAYAKGATRECTWYDNVHKNISKRVHDTYAWQCEKLHAACPLRAPIQGIYMGGS